MEVQPVVATCRRVWYQGRTVLIRANFYLPSKLRQFQQRRRTFEARMGDFKVYDSWDYRINNTLLGDEEPEGNRLLDESGEPTTYPTDSSVAGLAAIASAIQARLH